MKLSKLFEIVDEVYADSMIELYAKDPEGRHGDTLAKFIVMELTDTYDPEDTSEGQRAEAVRVMEMARNDLDTVIAALRTVGRRGRRKHAKAKVQA